MPPKVIVLLDAVNILNVPLPVTVPVFVDDELKIAFPFTIPAFVDDALNANEPAPVFITVLFIVFPVTAFGFRFGLFGYLFWSFGFLFLLGLRG